MTSHPNRARVAAALALALCTASPGMARAAEAPPLVELAPPPAAASGASGAIDPEAATRAYLDRLSPAEKRRSDAYFEGGYWLQLWDFLWAAAVYLLLLRTGFSARMRGLSERAVRARPLQVALYWVELALAVAVLSLPLTLYEGFFREHAYGLSNLTFRAWIWDQLKGLFLALALGALAFPVLYAALRRAGRAWWLWATALAVAFQVFVSVIGPIVIVPLFNTPKRLADERVVKPILSLARASGIQAKDVWQIDASKQSKRISANVSGLFGTERITLNDNLLARASLPEIEAVMGHEMGHYVLNHIYKAVLEFGLVIAIGLALVSALFERLRARNAHWAVRSLDDPAGLPLLALLFTAYSFLATPVTNSIVRTAEQEADWYGLQAAAQPDGFAQVALKIAEYRKLEPGPLEELLLYDHPSGRTRILTAMRWKAEHPETWARAPAPSSAPAAAVRP